MKIFGETMIVSAMSIQGKLTEDKCATLIKKIVKKMEMTPAAGEVTYQYPMDGKGGVGFTHIQPITESFIALDAWPDLNGAYLIICSCKCFSIDKVKLIIRNAGLKVLESKTNVLGLPCERS